MSKRSTKTVAAGAAAVIALATPFIAGWEGKRNYAYIPVPGDVPTICYGSTAGVKMGDYKTDAECEALLKREVGEFWARMDPCVDDAVPVSVQASILELGYNVGTSAACKSTMVKKANVGAYHEACAELDRWVRASGRVLKGLVNRRNASQEMCVRDL
jgi:GH24 family phage-related lysozyme (muramidase)